MLSSKIDDLKINPINKNLNDAKNANFTINVLQMIDNSRNTINNTQHINNAINMINYNNCKIDKFIDFSNAFKPRDIIIDTIFNAINYNGNFNDITQDMYLEMERNMILAIYADIKCPHNHTIIMFDDMFMCNGLNGWICSNEIDKFILRLRKTIWIIFTEIVREMCHNKNYPSNQVIPFLFDKLSIYTLTTNNIKETLLLLKNIVLSTIIDSADIIFNGSNGEIVLKQIVQNCNDCTWRESLEIVGRRIHPLIRFMRLEFLKNESDNFYSKDDVIDYSI
jgi:hypothetical protein